LVAFDIGRPLVGTFLCFPSDLIRGYMAAAALSGGRFGGFGFFDDGVAMSSPPLRPELRKEIFSGAGP
jgi:hypothetical protein